MSSEPRGALPEAPRSIEDENGHPRFGCYAGSPDAIHLGKLRGAYALGRAGRLLKHKRWLYTFVASREVIAVYAIADVGYTSNAFAFVVDRVGGKVVFDRSALGLPRPFVRVGDHPAEGLDAHFRTLGARLEASRAHGAEVYRQEVSMGGLTWRGLLTSIGAPPPLTVIAKVPNGGIVNVTQKRAALEASGSLELHGRRYSLEGGLGGLDYTNGYLARRTSWRWAFACGRLADGTPMGLNLVEGFNDSEGAVSENALWIGNDLIPLARARFTFTKTDVTRGWRCQTVDGAVDLHFSAIGVHRERRDYAIVKSYFAQPVGVFHGTIHDGHRVHTVADLPGVTEDQDILW